MKKKLKVKIFASFLLLIGLLSVAGTISIVEFRWLSNSVHGLIENNYKSIEASKTMLESLEREDSGILLLLLGDWSKGKEIINSADSSFTAAFEIAKNNLTEENEGQYIRKIDSSYQSFKQCWSNPITDSMLINDFEWYKKNIHQKFLVTKQAVNALMTLNQKSMYGEVSQLKEKSKRAMMPGIVAIISSLVFAIILNFFIARYFVNPLLHLTDAVNNIRSGDRFLKCRITSNDEIKKLEESINNLLSRIDSTK